jgi:small subunit ribosomal protein S4
MAHYLGAKCKRCRQLNFSVCGSERCALIRRPTPPGMHGEGRKKVSEYKKRMIEKQKLRFSYWLSEKQFRLYVKRAFQQRGVTGENLIRLLERRLDTVVYRSGFAATLLSARQLVNHGHILVNGRKVDKPACMITVGDTVSLREGSKGIVPVLAGLERSLARPTRPYIDVDKEALRGRLTSIPAREEVALDIDDSLVVEFYAKYI